MNVKNFIWGAVAVIVLVIGVNFPLNGTTVVEKVTNNVGAAAGPDVYVHTNFLEGMTDGGTVFSTTTTSATGILTAAQMEKAKLFRFLGSATAEAYTITLPASSTMASVLKNPGDYRTWVFENGYTAAATTTTIEAGTGIDLQEPDGQNVVIGINNYAFLTCFKEASTDIVCRVDETIPAD